MIFATPLVVAFMESSFVSNLNDRVLFPLIGKHRNSNTEIRLLISLCYLTAYGVPSSHETIPLEKSTFNGDLEFINILQRAVQDIYHPISNIVFLLRNDCGMP